ncbi:MAG: hypothetical protein Q8P82_03040 [bacterium]|nr:hypothetical protein [bacterium]
MTLLAGFIPLATRSRGSALEIVRVRGTCGTAHEEQCTYNNQNPLEVHLVLHPFAR